MLIRGSPLSASTVTAITQIILLIKSGSFSVVFGFGRLAPGSASY